METDSYVYIAPSRDFKYRYPTLHDFPLFHTLQPCQCTQSMHLPRYTVCQQRHVHLTKLRCAELPDCKPSQRFDPLRVKMDLDTIVAYILPCIDWRIMKNHTSCLVLPDT
jgi:hypothetical protein